MDEKDFYWLAGLLEGEGSFMKPSPSEPQCPRIAIDMTDRDVIERVAALFDRKYIYTRKHTRENWKDSHSTLMKSRKAVNLMRLLYPFMGERRRQQIENAIGESLQIPKADLGENWIYWLAGLLEGEGSFMKGSPKKPNKPRIHIKMTDEDVIQKVSEIFRVTYYGPYQINNKKSEAIWKSYYVTVLTSSRAIDLMKELRPLMGQRRQGQIDAVIESYAPIPRPRGEKHPQAKLTAEKVHDIKMRLAAGEKLTALAREHGVDQGLIWQIKAGRIWQHVT